MPTAVVIDGAYFLRRFRHTFPDLDAGSPEDVCLGVSAIADYHVAARLGPVPTLRAIEAREFLPVESPHLYRIFFYDCAPLTKRLHYLISKKALNLAKTPEALLRLAIHDRLTSVRKVALRLGRLNESVSAWRPKPDAVRRWIDSRNEFAPTDEDFEIDVVQKGVDMRLGLDIASMAFKRQVDQIILVAADADFVPVAKMARREGIDVVLDPMWGSPSKDLLQHVDGLRNARMGGSPRDS
jgi:uncharacterized LabA/DUF88 family protein